MMEIKKCLLSMIQATKSRWNELYNIISQDKSENIYHIYIYMLKGYCPKVFARKIESLLIFSI